MPFENTEQFNFRWLPDGVNMKLLNDLTYVTKSGRKSSKEDIKEIKETLGKLFDKVDEVANKLYEFVKDCNVR